MDDRQVGTSSVPVDDRPWLHVLLLALTFVTTTMVGALYYLSFEQLPNSDAVVQVPLRDLGFYLKGLWYSVPVLLILGVHEMGHYIACRYYRVDASLPYFLPAPVPITGTLGAVIRIRQRIPSRVALFDIGIAGPIAGFVVTLPTLMIALSLSQPVALSEDFSGILFGQPLLYRAGKWLMWGDLPNGMVLNLHPMGFAAWFGLLATAMNLFPIGQLDGGHITYAVLGRHSSNVTVISVALVVALTFVSVNWLLWSALLVVMIFLMGPHHPPTLNDDLRLGRTRMILAVLGLIMLIVCFTPVPITIVEGGQ